MYLDTTVYRPEYSNLCPLQVMDEGRAHCLDGAIFAAAALRRLGNAPLLVDLFPEPGLDDDHVLAVFQRNGRWGAVAKSNYVGLRELVMTYFEQFFNVNRVKTLRSYTRPLNLIQFDPLGWEWSQEGVDAIEQALLKRRRIPLLTAEMAAELEPVDELTYQAGMLAANPEGLFKPKTESSQEMDV